MGIAGRRIADTPVAVVDIYTTGLHPAGDRIVEIAVVRVDPGSEPYVALETLVQPGRPVAATEIHGISELDVAGAPTFAELAGELRELLSGCVLAAYNVYFDSKFLAAELARAGHRALPPQLCLMYMRPLLGLGMRCSLDDACREHGIRHRVGHVAAEDALAGARLWCCYLRELERQQLVTFGQLAARHPYRFTESFSADLLERAGGDVPLARRKSRWHVAGAERSPQRRQLLAEYWDTLKSALADLRVTDAEWCYLMEKQSSLGLFPDEVRSLHARVFAGILADASDDHRITESEVDAIAAMAEGLRKLGWAPGDHLAVVRGG